MARKSSTMLQRAFSPAEIATYSQLTVAIEGAQKQADGLARTIAGALAQIKARKLYEYEGYKNIYEYGEQRHGIARGTVSDAINVYERFQNPDKKGTLLPEYEPFAWRSLIMMKSIPTDEAIANLGITYDMKSAEIKQRVADYKEATGYLESLPKEWDYEFIKKTIEDAHAIPTTAAESDNAENIATESESTDSAETTNIQESDDTEVSESKNYKPIAQNMMTPEQWEAFESAETDLEDACEDYVNSFMEFPKKTVDLSTMSDKDAIALIKSLLAGARNNEYDIIITG